MREPEERAVRIPLPHWVTLLLGVVALALVPWILYLTFTLPSRHVTLHYDLAWVGFDIALTASFAATAWAALRGSHWLVDRLYTAATYNAAGVLTGPADLVRRPVGSAGPPKPVLGREWLLGVVCAIVLLFLYTPTFLFASFLRNRRLWRRPNEPLPPLPASALSPRGQQLSPGQVFRE